MRGDTSNLADLDHTYATIKARAGHIDVLAVNVGVYEFRTFGEITEDHFDKTFNTNVRGLLFAVQKALPLLVRGSSVILTGSTHRSRASPPSRCTMRQRPRCDHSRAAGSPTSTRIRINVSRPPGSPVDD